MPSCDCTVGLKNDAVGRLRGGEELRGDVALIVGTTRFR